MIFYLMNTQWICASIIFYPMTFLAHLIYVHMRYTQKLLNWRHYVSYISKPLEEHSSSHSSLDIYWWYLQQWLFHPPSIHLTIVWIPTCCAIFPQWFVLPLCDTISLRCITHCQFLLYAMRFTEMEEIFWNISTSFVYP